MALENFASYGVQVGWSSGNDTKKRTYNGLNSATTVAGGDVDYIYNTMDSWLGVLRTASISSGSFGSEVVTKSVRVRVSNG